MATALSLSLYKYMYICVCLSMYTYVYVYIYIYIHTYICIYTHLRVGAPPDIAFTMPADILCSCGRCSRGSMTAGRTAASSEFSYIIVCCTGPYYTILYYTILYHTILHYAMLYYTILHYAMLCYTMLYYTMLYYTGAARGPARFSSSEALSLLLLLL